MNIVLKKANTGRGVEYYIACIKKNGTYYVYGKYVTATNGKIREQSKCGPFETEEAAVCRCRALAKMKIRKKGFQEIALDAIPENIAPHLEVPPDMQVSPVEMIRFLKEAKRERYVVFKDTSGMEEFYDLGVEYLAHITDEDGYLVVFDRFGDPRECFAERMESIVATEDSKQAEGIKKL